MKHHHPFPPALRSIVALLLFLALCMTAWIGFHHTKEEQHYAALISAAQDPQTQTERAGKKLLEDLSFGLYEGYSEQHRQIQDWQQSREQTRITANAAAVGFHALVLVLLVWVYLSSGGYAKPPRDSALLFAYTLLLCSLPALAAGLLSPIMMMAAYQDLPVLGPTIFQFESKGVVQTITGLYQRNNAMIALVLLLFSVIIPLLKTLIMLGTGLHRWKPVALKGMVWVKHIGKWSMADVFVVALLLSYFTSEHAKATQAELQAGLWFFLGYVVMSLLASQLLAHHLPDHTPGHTPEPNR